MLRTHAHGGADFVHLCPDVPSVDEGRARGGREEARQDGPGDGEESTKNRLQLLWFFLLDCFFTTPNSYFESHHIHTFKSITHHLKVSLIPLKH